MTGGQSTNLTEIVTSLDFTQNSYFVAVCVPKWQGFSSFSRQAGSDEKLLQLGHRLQMKPNRGSNPSPLFPKLIQMFWVEMGFSIQKIYKESKTRGNKECKCRRYNWWFSNA